MRVVEQQIQDLDVQMQDLDDFVSRARSHNAGHHDRHAESVHGLTATVGQSFANISGHFKETFDRVHTLGDEMDADAQHLQGGLDPLDQDVLQPLAALRDEMQANALHEYAPTGDTPEKTQYEYPTILPRTAAHENLLAAMRDSPTPSPTPLKSSTSADAAVVPEISLTPARSPSTPSSGARSDRHGSAQQVRSLNPSVTAGPVLFDPTTTVFSPPPPAEGDPLLKPNANTSNTARTRPSRLSKRVPAVAAGAENVPPVMRGSSRRKSPRLR